jgi:large conductance mechanosensitive channel
MNNSRFGIGDFISALVSFILIACVVYFFVVVPVNRLMDRFKPEEPIEQRKRDCPECLSKIPVNARRCAFCTAEVGTAIAAAR